MSFPQREHWKLFEYVAWYFVFSDGLSAFYWASAGGSRKAWGFALALVVALVFGLIARTIADSYES